MSGGALRLSNELPRTADLVVVGGAIVGGATAFFASRAGTGRAVPERRLLRTRDHGLGRGSRLVVDLLVGAGDGSANPFRVDRRMDEREHDVL